MLKTKPLGSVNKFKKDVWKYWDEYVRRMQKMYCQGIRREEKRRKENIGKPPDRWF